MIDSHCHIAGQEFAGDLDQITLTEETFDPEGLQQLADSIAEFGLLQPIIVTEVGERFTLIALDAVKGFYDEMFLEVKLWGKKGVELAAESLYDEPE